MRYCSRCITPETHDTISYDEQGVCSVCRQLEYKNEKIDWNQRWAELQELISKYKGKGLYDCILPYSGGKDSVFQLWYIVKQLKLKPLVVRFNHWGYRDLVHENNQKIFKALGVDVIEFTPNWKVVRELMLESFRRRGDFCWHCHTGIYAGVIHMAVKFETSLIFWGESLAEYHSWYNYEEKEEVDEKRFNRAMNLGITADDMYEFLGGRVDKRDLWMFVYPPRSETNRIKLKSICLGSYIKWDTRKHVEIIKKELDWKGQAVEGVAPDWDYEKIECKFQGMRDFSKYVKRGYGRTNHLVSIDIRNGRIARDKGLELANQYDGKKPASMPYVLDILGISEEEYFEILESHAVHPWKLDRANLQTGPELPDMAKWDKSGTSEPVGPTREDGKLKKVFMITVVDYGMGNLRSLLNAFEYLGASIELQSKPEAILSASKLVIPGVGAFGDAMNNLRQRNLISALNEAVIQKKVPVLGICLGMQLMADSSDEHGHHQGLGWIPGKVIKLSPQDPSIKVPHVGWNSIRVAASNHSIFTDLKSEAHLSFYFVHSYHYAANKNQILAFSDHGQEFAAVVGDSNIVACQFHPEKSQDNGLQLLTNFIEWSGC